MQILSREQHEENVGKPAEIIEAHPVIITTTAKRRPLPGAPLARLLARCSSHKGNFIFRRLIGTRVSPFASKGFHSVVHLRVVHSFIDSSIPHFHRDDDDAVVVYAYADGTVIVRVSLKAQHGAALRTLKQSLASGKLN